MAVDLRVPMDPLFDAFGVPATVTPPDSAAITTMVIWAEPNPADLPFGAEWTRREPIRVAHLKRGDVPAAPRGTAILAAAKLGGPVVAWTVDGAHRDDDDVHSVTVVRADLAP